MLIFTVHQPLQNGKHKFGRKHKLTGGKEQQERRQYDATLFIVSFHVKGSCCEF